MIKRVACEHCGSPSKKNGPCWYYDNLASEMRRDGRGEEDVKAIYHFDPPCECDHYAEREIARNRRDGWMIVGIVIGIPFAALALAIFLLL